MTLWLTGYLFTMGLVMNGTMYDKATNVVKFFTCLLLFITWPFFLGAAASDIIENL